MEKFAGYGFNKSHAAAYALVAYQTAYLKAHHAAAFMAANMSAVMDDTDKVQQLFDDATPPTASRFCRRTSTAAITVSRRSTRSASATGWARSRARVRPRSVTSSKSARAMAPFKDLFDFCHRVDKRIVNRRVVESLVRAGAFDTVNDHRASLLASVGIALESAEQASRAVNQVSLFGDLEDTGILGLARRCPALERARSPAERKARARVLSVGPSVPEPRARAARASSRRASISSRRSRIRCCSPASSTASASR